MADAPDSPAPRKRPPGPGRGHRDKQGNGEGMGPGQGPAKGAGNGSPPHPLSAGPGRGHESIAGMEKRARIARWRERLDELAMSSPNHAAAVAALNSLLDRDEGKPAQVNINKHITDPNALTDDELAAIATAGGEVDPASAEVPA
jgi:hypothetical protein